MLDMELSPDILYLESDMPLTPDDMEDGRSFLPGGGKRQRRFFTDLKNRFHFDTFFERLLQILRRKAVPRGIP